MAILFQSYPYVPELLTSLPEHQGYRQLTNAEKQLILPIGTASRVREASDLQASIDMMAESFEDRPFILDLDKRPIPAPYEGQDLDPGQVERLRLSQEAQRAYNGELDRLLISDDGFAEWRDFVASFPHAIPTLQFGDPSGQARQILRQAALLSSEDRQLAIRIDRDTPESIYPVISQVISILPAPSDLLLIFDCGAARQQLAARATFAREGIARVLSLLDVHEQADVAAVCLSSSYPRSLSSDEITFVEGLDWRLWESAAEAFPFAFGDHAAVSRNPLASWTPRDWRPTVVYPLNEGWIINRDVNLNDENGFSRGATAVANDEHFDGYPDNAGGRLLRAAADGNLANANAPRFWHAAKVNMHLSRQLRHARDRFGAWGEDAS